VDEQTATMGDDFDYPADDSDTTWHMHDDKTWGWGVNCPVCYTAPIPKTYTGPFFNIGHLKMQNVLGKTVREMEKDVIGDRNHDEIQRPV